MLRKRKEQSLRWETSGEKSINEFESSRNFAPSQNIRRKEGAPFQTFFAPARLAFILKNKSKNKHGLSALQKALIHQPLSCLPNNSIRNSLNSTESLDHTKIQRMLMLFTQLLRELTTRRPAKLWQDYFPLRVASFSLFFLMIFSIGLFLLSKNYSIKFLFIIRL